VALPTTGGIRATPSLSSGTGTFSATPYPAIFKFDLLSATGTAILIAAIVAVLYLKAWRCLRPAAYALPLR
jgi:L-lactate permease